MKRVAQQLFRKKCLLKEQSLETPLERCLSLTHLIFYSISHMAGAGIYVLTGRLVRDQAGPAAFLSYTMAALSALFTAMCYAEFASFIPKTGSVYTYTYLMLGELPAFIIAWTTISDLLVGLASVAKAFSGTIDLLTQGAISNWTLHTVGHFPHSTEHYLDKSVDLLAALFLILLVILTLTGAHFSLTVNACLTVVQVMCLLIIGVACFVFGNISQHWSASEGGFAPNGFQGIVEGASIAVFAFSGFEALANASEETKNPRRSIPIALFTSLFIITLLYGLASIGLSAVIERDHINYKSPFVAAFDDLHLPVLKWIAAVGTLLATGATKISSMYVVPRMFYAMAADGLLFRPVAYIQPHTKVPLVALLLTGLISALLALLLNIQTLADFSTLGLLFSYMMIGLNLMLLRYTHLTESMFENSRGATPVEELHSLDTFVNDDEDSDGDNCGQKLLLPESKPKRDSLSVQLQFRQWAASSCHWTPNFGKFYVLLSLFLLAVVLLATFVDYFLHDAGVWLWMLFTVIALAVLITFILLTTFQPKENPNGFQAPFMPMAPCMTILVNTILIIRLPWITWVRFTIWTIIGLVIYFSYGYRHSSMAKEESKAPAKLNVSYKMLPECSNMTEEDISVTSGAFGNPFDAEITYDAGNNNPFVSINGGGSDVSISPNSVSIPPMPHDASDSDEL